MIVLADSVETKVLHTRTIQLHDAPRLLTNNYYGPKGETYEPKTLTIKWYEGDEPKTVDLEGVMDDGKTIKRSFGKGAPAIPEWLQEIAFGL